MDLNAVTDHIRNAVGDNSGLGKTVKLDLGDVGKIFIGEVASILGEIQRRSPR